MDEYSGAAKYNVDSINFIDSVNESSLTTQHTSQMPMKYAEHVDYSFTSVIDNFIGLYGKELKLTRDDFIKLHQDYYKSIFSTSSDLDDGIETNKGWKLEEGISPSFLDYVCKKYDISHYAYDINDECFMK